MANLSERRGYLTPLVHASGLSHTLLESPPIVQGLKTESKFFSSPPIMIFKITAPFLLLAVTMISTMVSAKPVVSGTFGKELSNFHASLKF